MKNIPIQVWWTQISNKNKHFYVNKFFKNNMTPKNSSTSWTKSWTLAIILTFVHTRSSDKLFMNSKSWKIPLMNHQETKNNHILTTPPYKAQSQNSNNQLPISNPNKFSLYFFTLNQDKTHAQRSLAVIQQVLSMQKNWKQICWCWKSESLRFRVIQSSYFSP